MKKITLLASLLIFNSLTALAENAPMDSDGPQHKDITRAEFLKRAETHFTKMDANADGVLTPDERKAGRENMREHRRAHRDHPSGNATPPAQ